MIFEENDQVKKWLPRLQCHRGYWIDGLPQNTLDSVSAAYKRGYEICEIDVRLTADEQVVLFHDATIKGTKITDLALNDLRGFAMVSTLDEVFRWLLSVDRFKLNIEIKSNDLVNFRLEQLVCKLIAEHGVEDRVFVSSFNPLSLAKVRYFNPRIFRALLLTFENEPGNTWFVKSGLLNYLCRPHMLNIRDQDFLQFKSSFKVLSEKVPVVLWTVNDPQVFRANRESIHGVISDRITPSDIE